MNRPETAEDVALVDGPHHLTCAELTTRADRLARVLRGRGVGPERIVGLHAARSVERVVGLLGVLKAGGAWLPIDDHEPPARIESLLRHARPDLVLTQTRLRDRLGGWPGPVVVLDGDRDGDGADVGPATAAEDQLACVEYAFDHGVLGTRRGLRDHLAWRQQQFALTGADVVLHRAPLSGNAAAGEVLWPLLYGGQVVLGPDPLEIDRLPGLIAEHGISILHLDSSELAAFLTAARGQPQASLMTLRRVLCGGEPLRRAEIEGFFALSGRVASERAELAGAAVRGLRLTYLYGPAEAGTAALAFTCRPGEVHEVAPLGTPTHVPVFVLDRHLRPVPFGVEGEICVAGDSLARGYVHDPEATAHRFGPSPFPNRPGERLFRTGDRGRQRADGTIALAAPAHRTAWVAGLRVPLDAIEEVILRDPSIRDCAVRARGAGLTGSTLLAYVVPSGPFVGERLAAHARALLPGSLPGPLFVPLAALPRAADGRIDEDALNGLETIDDDLIQRWEEALRALPEIREAAVVAREQGEAGGLLHLSDLLPEPVAVPRRVAGVAVLRNPGRGHPAPALSDGGPLVVETDAPDTLAATLRRAVARAPEETIVHIQADGGESVQTYRELATEALSVLSGLNRLGLRPGDKVLFQLDDTRDFVHAFWACALGGLVPAPLPVPPTFEQSHGLLTRLQQALELLEGPVILTSREHAPDLAGWTPPGVRVAVIDDLRGGPSEAVTHDGDPEDLAVLLLTSGSTGTAKGVMLSHRNVLSMCAGTVQRNGFTDRDVSLNWVGLDHVGALVPHLIMPAYLGCRQVHGPTTAVLEDPLRWLDWLDRYRVSIAWAPNFVYGLVNDRADRVAAGRWDLSALRFLINAGEAIVVATAERFLQGLRPHGLPASAMRPAFGMSETCSGITWSDGFLPDSAADGPRDPVELGAPIPGAALRIVDDQGHVVAEGVVGRLRIQGRSVTSGYYRDPERTRAALDEDGWLDTGDLGFLRDGRLTLTGREKDVIIINGVNYPNHAIEAAVEEVEGVEPSWTAAVAVRPPDAATEQLAIFFSPREPSDEPALGLLQRIRERVARGLGVNPSYVVPVPRAAVPKTAIGKIQRAQLARRLEAGEFHETLKRIDLQTGGRRTVPDWFYQTIWRPCAAVSQTRRPDGRMLIFPDSCGLSARLGTSEAVLVDAGPDFNRMRADHYRINPAEPTHYLRLFESLAQDGVVIDRVLHLATYTPAATAIPDLETFGERSALGLLYLVQALARQGATTRPTRLLVVSSQAQATADDDVVCPEKALVAGLPPTVARELAWLSCQHVDLPGERPDLDAGLVLAELAARPTEGAVAYRQGRRLVPRLEKASWRPEERRELPFRRDGVYLLTGGLGGIGREVAAWLLREFQVHLLVLGRTSLLPVADGDDQNRDTLRRLEALGTVRYEAVDVADETAARQAVGRAEADWGRGLDGVLHLAGVRHDCGLTEETARGFAAALRPKVAGARVLDRIVQERPGCMFLGFSSVNSFFGGVQAGAYSAANRFVELLTHQQRQQGRSASWCLSWSMWDDVGMSRDFPLKELARQRGYLPVTVEQGLNSLRATLSRPPRALLIGIEGTNPSLRGDVETEDAATQHLVAYVTAAAGPLDPSRLQALEVRDQFQRRTHCTFVTLPELPKMEEGEIDRDRLGAATGWTSPTNRSQQAPRTELERQLARLWQEVLQMPKVSIHDNFFELGGHSLLAAQLMARVASTTGADLPLSSLFSNPTVAGFAEAVERYQRNGATAEFALDLRAEAVLDPAIQPGPLPPGDPVRPTRVLLTGATGFLGAFLLRDLLEQTPAAVACLVRAASAAEALGRIQANLAKYSLWREEYAPRLIPLAGDLSQPRLGLTAEQFQELAERTDVIYHNGAQVNFIYPYQALKASNVLGTVEVLRLACAGRVKPVHYVSTLSVFPLIDLNGAGTATEVEALPPPEALLDGYSQSKWVAEHLLRAAGARGLPVTIYRPGRITGDSQTGVGESDDPMWKLIRQTLQSGLAPAVDVLVDMTPVDFASRALVHLATRPASAGQTFHLVNPRSLTWSALCDRFRARGFPLRQVPATRWQDQVRVVLGQDVENGLFFSWLPLLAALTTDEGPLVLPQLRYECGNTLAGLEGTAIACPPVDDRLLGTYLDHLVRNGFLAPPPGQ